MGSGAVLRGRQRPTESRLACAGVLRRRDAWTAWREASQISRIFCQNERPTTGAPPRPPSRPPPRPPSWPLPPPHAPRTARPTMQGSFGFSCFSRRSTSLSVLDRQRNPPLSAG